MAVPNRWGLLSKPSHQLMASRLAAVDIKLLKRVRSELGVAAPLAPVTRTARQKAAAAILEARAKAAAERTPAAARKAAKLKAEMAAAKARLDKRWQPGAMRSPAQVATAVMNRVEAAPRPPPREEETSLLIHSVEPDLPAFAARLAQTLGLANAEALAAKGIRLASVLPAKDGKGAVYSVRLPLKHATMKAEVHNFAWALRKTGAFQAVAPDGARRMIFAAAPGHAGRAERVVAWPLVMTRADLAQQLPPQSTGRALGENIIIAHPDTGWALHPNLNQEQIDRRRSFNASTGTTGADAAQTSTAIADAGIRSLNHGTATASVMIGAKLPDDGISTLPEADLEFARTWAGGRDFDSSDKVRDGRAELRGVAPRATLRSIKFIDDVQVDVDRTGINGIAVVRFADEDLVVAIDGARRSGAHVISLSIGGLMHDPVRRIIDEVVEDDDVIVVAAAGQTYSGEGLSMLASAAAGVGIGGGDTVVLPAAYRNVIAVAGCTPDGRPWDESFRGPNVDITAPSDAMWVADFKVEGRKRTPVLEAASGTSFGAAFIAGVAALWLGHWGREALLERYQETRTPLAWVFRHLLQKTARPVREDEWDTKLYGPGIVDVLALLKEPLPHPRGVPQPPATVENVFTALSGLTDSPAAQLSGNVWRALWDAATAASSAADTFVNASWAAAAGAADAMVDLGEQTLTELHAWTDRQGQAAAAATGRAAIGEMTGFVDAAAAAAEEAKQAAAEETEKAVEASVDLVEQVADSVGEVAEDVADFLFGWAAK